MGKEYTDVRVALKRDFAAVGTFVSGEGYMPAPSMPLVTSAQNPPDSPVVELFEGSLSHYPLKLSDIVLREKLYAYFDFWCAGREYPLLTCFDREQLDVREKELLIFAYEPIAEWNLLQIKAAKKFIDDAPLQGRAVSLSTLRAFQEDPYRYCAAMMATPLPRF